jgi:dehydrogenase/reductase SDR family protein 7B
MKKFQDKVVWITGASSGIGEALAYAFADCGAKLALSARKLDALERVKANCREPASVLIAPLDVAQFDAVSGVAQAIVDHFGYVNILINNAGISQRALVKDTDFAVDQQVMNVNYLGTVAVTKAILPTLLQQRFGQIVVISSVMGKIGTPLRSAYAASKHALHGYFDSLRAELYHEGVSVTVICPGYVNTNVTINALTGDGSPNQIKAPSTAHGLAPEVFARKALRVIAKRRREALIGGREMIAIYLQRFFPALLAYLLPRIKTS